jgi:hypothetical protein
VSGAAAAQAAGSSECSGDACVDETLSDCSGGACEMADEEACAGSECASCVESCIDKPACGDKPVTPTIQE